MKLKIIHTNDVHSHFDNYAKAVSLIRELKDENAILLEAGDFNDFRSIELRGTRGLAGIEILEAAGYDALTLGNNETYTGTETMAGMAAESSFPVISNNLLKKNGSPIEGVVPSAILEKNGLKILVTGSSPDLEEFNEGLGISVLDFKKAVLREIEKHRAEVDLVILLSHVGTEADAILAEEVPGIDVIISAHDHKLYNEAKIINGTILNSAGSFGNHVGILELVVEGPDVRLSHSATVPTADYDADERILEILADNKQKAVKALSQPLYKLAQPLWHDVVEENPLTNLIADSLKHMLKTDIGLMNSGIANCGLFDFVTEKKLLEVSPSPLNVTRFEIQGKYLLKAFNGALDPQLCLADGRGPGFRGKFVGRLHISGAEIFHDGEHVLSVKIGGEEIVPERWYSVATSDYLQRGGGYPPLVNNRNDRYWPEEIRDVIRIYAEKSDFVADAKHARWKHKQVVKG